MTQIVSPPNMPQPRGYADGLIVPSGRLLFISGQIAWDKDARIVSRTSRRSSSPRSTT